MFTPVTWSRSPARWLRITAVIELVVAGGLFAAGMFAPEAKGTLWLTGGILGGVALLLFLWGGRWSARFQEAQRIKATGLPGQAQITGMRQTGVYLNEQPQVELELQVTSPVQGPYPVTLKEYVPMIMLGRLTSGMPLPVKVDPQNPQNVVIEWEASGTATPAVAAGGPASGAPAGDPSDVKKWLLREGTPGTATVLTASETGEIDAEGRPVFDLTLRIEVPGMAPMAGPARVGVPPERREQLEEGDTVPIRVDPKNPSVMAVDWDSA